MYLIRFITGGREKVKEVGGGGGGEGERWHTTLNREEEEWSRVKWKMGTQIPPSPSATLFPDDALATLSPSPFPFHQLPSPSPCPSPSHPLPLTLPLHQLPSPSPSPSPSHPLPLTLTLHQLPSPSPSPSPSHPLPHTCPSQSINYSLVHFMSHTLRHHNLNPQ